MSKEIDHRHYDAVARSLREFGYADVTSQMIREVHEAMQSGAELPHGVIGMFARGQLSEFLGDEP